MHLRDPVHERRPKAVDGVSQAHLVADQRLHGVVRLASGSAASATAKYQCVGCGLNRLDALEQSHRSPAQGDRPRDTGFHMFGRHVPSIAVDLAPRRSDDLAGSWATGEQQQVECACCCLRALPQLGEEAWHIPPRHRWSRLYDRRHARKEPQDVDTGVGTAEIAPDRQQWHVRLSGRCVPGRVARSHWWFPRRAR